MDTTIRLWNLNYLDMEPHILRGHESFIASVAINSDGQMLTSGSADNTVRLWNLSQSEVEPRVLRSHKSDSWSVTFSPDGQTLAVGSGDGTIRLWIVSIEKLAEIGCRKVHRNLARAEWNQYLPGQDYRQTCPNLPPGTE